MIDGIKRIVWGKPAAAAQGLEEKIDTGLGTPVKARSCTDSSGLEARGPPSTYVNILAAQLALHAIPDLQVSWCKTLHPSLTHASGGD